MSGVVLLRNFDYCGIPKDLRVTFVDDLPEDALCIQCDNVSAVLYRDKRSHGYCRSCRAMCERNGAFACATCEKEYKTSELMPDFSTSGKIKTARVICPNSSKSDPVIITFKALEAHLKQCTCNEVADEPAGSSTRSYATVHMSHAANKVTAEHTSLFESRVYPTRNEHPVSSTESSELARLLQEALSKISHLENEVTELNKVANKEKGVMEMLQVAVLTIQGDMRNVQIRCEKGIAKSEKSLKEFHGSIQQALSVISEETKASLDAVEESMKEMNEKVSTVAHSLQEQSRYLHASNQLVFAQLEEIKNNFYNVLNFIAEGQGKQAHEHSN